jgi:oligosaccharide repeat unit polymerase
MFTKQYDFSKNIALTSFIFILCCLFSFLLGYSIFFKKLKTISINRNINRYEIIFLCLMFNSLVIYILIAGFVTGFNYGLMTQFREKYNFFFELRMLPLIIFSHILHNVSIQKIIRESKFKSLRFSLIFYIIALVLFQVRSPIFEIVFVIVFSHLMWTGDRFKLKYLVILFIATIVPNIIILGRIGIPENFDVLIEGLFSIEYSIMLNQLLGTAITSSENLHQGLSFLPQLSLIIPSPIRYLFNINATNNDFFLNVSDYAGIHGGGFSLFAQTYLDFGWYSIIVFFFLGLFIGKLNKGASRVGGVSFVYSVAPLIFALFILTIRNDLGVFIKYSFQALIIAFCLELFFNLFKKESKI